MRFLPKYQRGFAHVLVLVVLLVGLVTATILATQPGLIQYKSKAQTVIEKAISGISPDSEESDLGKTYQELLDGSQIQPIGGILEIQLAYNKDSRPSLSITKLEAKNGYPQAYTIEEPDYLIELTGKSGEVIYSQSFLIPNTVNPERLFNEGLEVREPIQLSQVNFALTLPWYEGAEEVRISYKKAVIASQPLEGIPVTDNQPAFRTTVGSEVVGKKSEKVLGISSATGDGYLDLAFIGDKYTNLADFHNDYKRLRDHLLTYEPFRSRASQIRFHYVDNTADLGCKWGAVLPGGIGGLECLNSTITTVVNNAGVPRDKIVVLINNQQNSGQQAYGYGMVMVSNGNWAHQVLMHELGHELGSLSEEYILYDMPSAGWNVGTLINCNKDVPDYSNPNWVSSKAWWDHVALKDYLKGCWYNDLYRAYENTIMRGVGPNQAFYSAPAQMQLNKAIDAIAGPFVDDVKPTAGITSPANGASVSGDVTITTVSSDNNGIAWVELWVDNILYHNEYKTPFTFSWLASEQSSGNHVLQVKAYDAMGNEGRSSEIKVLVGPGISVASPTPTAVPTLAPAPIPSSAPAANYKGQFGQANCSNFRGWACDANQPSSPLTIRFYKDTVSDSSSYLGSVVADRQGYQTVSSQCGGNLYHRFLYQTPQAVKDGKPHKIIALAGNYQLPISNPMIITCSQSPQTPTPLPIGVPTPPPGTGETGPKVVITSPDTQRRYFSGETITISADVSDNTGVKEVEFYYENNLIAGCTKSSEPYSCLYTLSDVGWLSTRTITVVAYNNAGKSASKPIRINTWY